MLNQPVLSGLVIAKTIPILLLCILRASGISYYMLHECGFLLNPKELTFNTVQQLSNEDHGIVIYRLNLSSMIGHFVLIARQKLEHH